MNLSKDIKSIVFNYLNLPLSYYKEYYSDMMTQIEGDININEVNVRTSKDSHSDIIWKKFGCNGYIRNNGCIDLHFDTDEIINNRTDIHICNPYRSLEDPKYFEMPSIVNMRKFLTIIKNCIWIGKIELDVNWTNETEIPLLDKYKYS
jgi:hypothetical protein